LWPAQPFDAHAWTSLFPFIVLPPPTAILPWCFTSDLFSLRFPLLPRFSHTRSLGALITSMEPTNTLISLPHWHFSISFLWNYMRLWDDIQDALKGRSRERWWGMSWVKGNDEDTLGCMPDSCGGWIQQGWL
jgi:hypothetical protein